MLSNATVSLAFGILLFTIIDASFGVVAFSSTNRNPARIAPTLLPVATIDAAELFDGSFFVGDTNDTGLVENNVVESSTKGVGSDAGTTSHASSANAAIDKLSRSSLLTWTAIGTTILSLYAALNTRAIGSSSLRSMLSTISSWYLTRLEVAPLLTKCITGGIIALIGDYGAQWFEYKSRRSNLVRRQSKEEAGVSSRSDSAFSLRAGAADDHRLSKSFSIHGTYNFRRGVARFLECLLISSPMMHYGYDLFESIMPVVGGVGMYRSFAALTHVFADSVFLDGIFVFTGILATGLLEGHSLRKHVIPNLRNVYVPTLKASVMTSGALMPLQFLSFRFLPVQLRVLSVNAVDLIWTAVVSFVSHSGVDNVGPSHKK